MGRLCYHLSCRLMIFINVVTFLCVKANYKEMCEEIPLFVFYKNADVSLFVRISRVIISEKYVATPSFLRGSQKPSLVCTLSTWSCIRGSLIALIVLFHKLLQLLKDSWVNGWWLCFDLRHIFCHCRQR